MFSASLHMISSRIKIKQSAIPYLFIYIIQLQKTFYYNYYSSLKQKSVMLCLLTFLSSRLVILCLLAKEGRKEGNVLFNYALNTFYLKLYDIKHIVKDYSNSERGNPLTPHGQQFPISTNVFFICIIPQTG